MPSNLRFVLILLGLAAVSAPVSVAVLHREDTQAARINAEAMTGGNAARGKAALDRYGCKACHLMALTSGPNGAVGPSLSDIAIRAHIDGKFANTPANMIAWLRFPQRLDPGCGMPDQALTEAEARDIAAYLYTLRQRSG